jgi:hypothetical protein
MTNFLINGVRCRGVDWRRGLLLFAAALAAPLTPAKAQGADFSVRELSRNDIEYLRTVRPAADCLVAHGAQEIPKFLGAPLNVAWGIGRGMIKSHPECPRLKSTDNDMSLILQGAILEALIRRDFDKARPPVSFSQVPRFVYVRDTSNELIRQQVASEMEEYDCATRAEPAKVQAFLKTEPLSAEEASAFASLRPALTSWLAKGEKWAIPAFYARRFLAETFYTLMKIDQRRKAGSQ